MNFIMYVRNRKTENRNLLISLLPAQLNLQLDVALSVTQRVITMYVDVCRT